MSEATDETAPPVVLGTAPDVAGTPWLLAPPVEQLETVTLDEMG